MLWGWVVGAGEIQLCCSVAHNWEAREGMWSGDGCFVESLEPELYVQNPTGTIQGRKLYGLEQRWSLSAFVGVGA